jgi:hypothetical protein
MASSWEQFKFGQSSCSTHGGCVAHVIALQVMANLTEADSLSPTDHERQPLLDPNGVELESEITADHGSIEITDVPPKKLSKWAIAWYIFLGVAGLFLLAMFIKGFIDADDVDVRCQAC